MSAYPFEGTIICAMDVSYLGIAGIAAEASFFDGVFSGSRSEEMVIVMAVVNINIIKNPPSVINIL